MEENNLRKRTHPDQEAADPLDPIDPQNINIPCPTYPYKSLEEYATSVNQWLWQCYNFQCMAYVMPFVMSQSALQQQSPHSTGTTDFNRNFPNNFFPNQNVSFNGPNRNQVGVQNATQAGNQSNQAGTVYLIPSLFRRLTAEFLDFCVFLVLKIVITYVMVEYFSFMDFDDYYIDILKGEKFDYQTAMEFTSKIITLEIVHRFSVCIFEALFTYKNHFGRGAATPGKDLMGLRIVSCDSVTFVDSNRVRVYPAKDLGLGWAFLRAFIKNFSYAFIFPICCTMYFFQHNRTGYDIMCGSIVVQDPPPQ